MKKKGIAIEFLSRDVLAKKSFNQKMDMIVKKAKNKSIVVMEEALNAEEKKMLIERSMKEVSRTFPGLEFVGFDPKETWIDKIFTAVTGKREGLMIVGSSDVIEKVREEKDVISLLAKIK